MRKINKDRIENLELFTMHLEDQIHDMFNALNDLFTFLEASRIDVDDKTGIGKVVSIRKPKAVKKGKK